MPGTILLGQGLIIFGQKNKKKTYKTTRTKLYIEAACCLQRQKCLWPDHQYKIDNKLGQIWAKRKFEKSLEWYQEYF